MPPDNPIGTPFIELSEVDSSNNYAMRQVQAHLAGHGATWFAHFQNAGRGQRGKAWKAEPGQNIMMSFILDTSSLSIDYQFVLTMSVALACNDYFNKYTNGDTTIKWPNDIYWKDRKAGGILIDNILQGKNWKYSIVGIGLNINQTLFPKHLPNPVSLKQITSRNIKVIEGAKELLYMVDQRWQSLFKRDKQDILQEYCEALYKRNQTVTFKTGNAVFNAVVAGVNQNGELLLNNENQMAVPFGTVEWMIA